MNRETDQALTPAATDAVAHTSVLPRATELTARAIVAGCMIGALLAAGNVYTGLKTGYIDGGSITAAVVAFALLGTARSGKRPYSIAENNLTQTIASSAAVMAIVTGVMGPIPALALNGHVYPFWTIALWGIALGALGVVIARSLRHRLIEVDDLPFPTGRATGEVIETMHAAGSKELGHAWILLGAAIVAALVTWFRDAKPMLLPQAVTLPWGHTALIAAGLWLSVSVSPVMVAAGVLIGPRGGVSVLIGTVGAWCLLAPALLARHWVTDASYGALSGWLLWPGVALLVSSAFTALLMDWRAIVRGARDLFTMRKAAIDRHDSYRAERGFWALVAGASVLVSLVMGWTVFGINPLLLLAALAFAFVMAGVCARAAGETDQAPTGSAGALGQILFGAPNIITSLLCGSAVAGPASQTAQTMWAFKAGHRLKANAHVQAIAQLLGLVVGGMVVVPVYSLIVSVYGIGTTVMPAPGAISWKATAEAVHLGTTAMPNGAGWATMFAFAVGVALTLLGNTRIARFLPSAVPLGMAFLLPAPLGGAIFMGSMAFAILRALRPQWTEQHVPSLAAGAIAGESLTGIVIAALFATGFLG